MTFLSWRDVDFAAVVLSGLAAGYLMALVGLWAGRVPGLIAIDIADFGRRYMVSDRPSAWLLGLASHLANSILLVLVFAAVIQPNFGLHAVLLGVLWGVFLAIALAGLIVSSLAGMGAMGLRAGGPRLLLTNLAMHTAWGLVVGLLYTPR